jgi:prefoldin beta subunit
LLAPKSKVYKLVGPILINVDLEEAKENVGKRLEFIEAEVHKVDASIGEAITSLRT